MRLYWGFSTVLGVIGVVSAFGLFYLGERVFHLDRAHIQTLMYLKLSVAGHSDDFPDAYARPVLVHTSARDSMAGVLGHANGGDSDCGLWTVYDTPWLGLGSVRWGYALAWFLVNDRVKLLAYRIF